VFNGPFIIVKSFVIYDFISYIYCMNWISLKDRLPDEMTPVMVWDPDYFDYGIGVAEIRYFGDGFGWIEEGDIKTFLNPTHWGPIIEGPDLKEYPKEIDKFVPSIPKSDNSFTFIPLVDSLLTSTSSIESHYDMSTDYEDLYQLLNKKNSWALGQVYLNDDENEDMWVGAEILPLTITPVVGSPSLCLNKKEFISECKRLKLQWITPNK